MSYHLYKGVVNCAVGRGDNRIVSDNADVSGVIPTGLKSNELIKAFTDKYGDAVVSDLIFKAWKIEIQKAGRNALSLETPDKGKAATDIVNAANGNLVTVRKAGIPKVKVTRDMLTQRVKDSGVSGKQLDKIVDSILAGLV